jgi:hypothetical protein
LEPDVELLLLELPFFYYLEKHKGLNVIRYKSTGARINAVTAVAVNAAARLSPGVGESSISNNAGSGSAKVAASTLLSQVSIESNRAEYTKVEFEPTLAEVKW